MFVLAFKKKKSTTIIIPPSTESQTIKITLLGHKDGIIKIGFEADRQIKIPLPTREIDLPS